MRVSQAPSRTPHRAKKARSDAQTRPIQQAGLTYDHPWSLENPSDYLLRVVKHQIAQAERDDQPADAVAYQVADKVERMTPLQRAALLDALDRLPIQAEEEIYDPGNWALIGISLLGDPLTVAFGGNVRQLRTDSGDSRGIAVGECPKHGHVRRIEPVSPIAGRHPANADFR